MELEAFEKLCRKALVTNIAFAADRPIVAMVGTTEVVSPSLVDLTKWLEEVTGDELWAVIRSSTLKELVEGNVRSIYIDLVPKRKVAEVRAALDGDWEIVCCECAELWHLEYPVYHLYANESAAQRDAETVPHHRAWITKSPLLRRVYP